MQCSSSKRNLICSVLARLRQHLHRCLFHCEATALKEYFLSVSQVLIQVDNSNCKIKAFTFNNIVHLLSLSIVNFYVGGGEGSRTPVRKNLYTTFSERSPLLKFPARVISGQTVRVGSFISHGQPQSLSRLTFTAEWHRVRGRSRPRGDGCRKSGSESYFIRVSV